MLTDVLLDVDAVPDRTAVDGQPGAFCWAKYGTESGESVAGILARKEQERVANAGTFLWGIGNSIRPSLSALLRRTSRPDVIFSAMKSAPASHDVSPGHVAFWDAGVDLAGDTFKMPAGSVVTSRSAPASVRPHFALVCFSEETIEEGIGRELVAGQLQNLLTGTRPGSSQVTSVVRENQTLPATGARYKRGFAAQLVYPYLVKLTKSAVVPATRLPAAGELTTLLEMRHSLFASRPGD